MKKKYFKIFFILIFAFIFLFYSLCTPENYLKYIFLNLSNNNYKVINYLEEKEQSVLEKIYLFSKKNQYSKPEYLIKKNSNKYDVILISNLYSKSKSNYRAQIGRYYIRLEITLERNKLFIPRIKTVHLIEEKSK